MEVSALVVLDLRPSADAVLGCMVMFSALHLCKTGVDGFRAVLWICGVVGKVSVPFLALS